MRFASAIVHEHSAERATARLIEPIEQRMTPGMADLVLLFATPHFEEELPKVLERLAAVFPTAAMLGCTAEGTIGADKEIERLPSMSLLAASIPGVEIRPFHLKQRDVEAAANADHWERLVGAAPDSQPVFLGFADPFSIPVLELVERLNRDYPGSPLIGGIASGARAPRENRLILNGEIYREGMVGAALTGNLKVDTVVSQGCRPIGKPYVITKGERNIIHELGGKPALERLQETYASLTAEDEPLARQSLFVGRVIDEYKKSFARGDFLIHNIVGADRKTGAIGIAARARVGTTVQFHVRDAKSADEDLRLLLTPRAGRPFEGAMLFGCNGRGTNMWPQPGHDVGVLHEMLGDVPVAGFFCGGEFGPVGGKNFVHGFTASIALFSEPDASQTQ